MSKTNPPRLAIIGGGQLGLLLCEAARKLDIHSLVVTPDRAAPALTSANRSIIENLSADGLAARIANQCDVVTFEFENVPATLLECLDELQGAGRLEVRPCVATMKRLQDKSRQKRWLLESGFPTLPFRAVSDPSLIREELCGYFGLPFVQKAQAGGYDGYGVQVLRTEQELAGIWSVPSVIEPFLADPVELAVVVARSVSGEVFAYPPVRMDFDSRRNVLNAVVLPTGFSPDLEARAQRLACEVVRKLDGVGVFAVEMFLARDDQLLVNEVSPRVHNSGHITLESAPVSQFEQHVRAVCGLPLEDPGGLPPAAVMRNLLYSNELDFMLGRPPGLYRPADKNISLYWYGKKEARPGRKMGHLTCLSSDPAYLRLPIHRLLKFDSVPTAGTAV